MDNGSSTFYLRLSPPSFWALDNLAAANTVRQLWSEIPSPPEWDLEAFVERMQSFILLDELDRQAVAIGTRALIALHLFLQSLSRHQAIELATARQNWLASLRPISPQFVLSFPLVSENSRYRLSRFAYMRRDANKLLVLETPRGFARVTLNDSKAVLCIHRLVEGSTIEELAVGGCKEEIKTFVEILKIGSFIECCDGIESYTEDQDSTLRQWEFHDLLFHSRSRLGRQDTPMGGTFRFQGELDPQPVVKQNPWRTSAIPLYRPDIVRMAINDPSFTTVVESRQSIRKHGIVPLTLEQLGEFLYRVARVRGFENTPFGEFTNRPYPNGGASYELEIYVTANYCGGLERGFYYYDPINHTLCLVSRPNEDMELLLQDAWVSSAQTCVPQVLLTISSRFQRVSWKYSGMAYATQLKNVGVLYAMMYLVATAMNLAPCALGLGNSDRFSRLTRTSYYQESSLGEFMLGSRGPDA